MTLSAGSASLLIVPDAKLFGALLSAQIRPQLLGVERSLNSSSRSAANFGTSLTRGITVPLGLAIGAAAVLATNFASAFNKIEGLVGLSHNVVEKFRGEVLSLAKDTARSPQELADALYFIVSSGIDASHAMDVLKVSAEAAAAGLGDTALIADAITSALNAYRDAGLTAAEATDILTAAVRLGKGEPREYATAIGYVIPIASQAGVAFYEVAAALAAASLSGNDVSRSAQGLRYLLTALIRPTQQAQGVLRDFGFSMEGIQETLRTKGLLEALTQLKRRLTLTDFLKVVGGARGAVVALQLVGSNADHVREVFKQTEESTGDLGRALEVASQGPRFKFNKAMAEIQIAAINLGAALLPVLTTVALAIGSVANAFSALPKPVQTFIALTALAALTLKPLIGTLINYAAAQQAAARAVELEAIAEEIAAVRRNRTGASLGLSLLQLEARQKALRNAELAGIGTVRLFGASLTQLGLVALGIGLNIYSTARVIGYFAEQSKLQHQEISSLADTLLQVPGSYHTLAVEVDSARLAFVKANKEYGRMAAITATTDAQLAAMQKLAGELQAAEDLLNKAWTEGNNVLTIYKAKVEATSGPLRGGALNAYNHAVANKNLGESMRALIGFQAAGVNGWIDYNRVTRGMIGISNDQRRTLGYAIADIQKLGHSLNETQVQQLRTYLSTGNWTGAEKLLGRALKDVGGDLDNVLDKVQKVKDAHNLAALAALAQRDAELALAGGLLGIQGAIFSIKDSQIALTQAQKDYNEAIKKHGPASKEAASAYFDLQKAQLAALNSQLGLRTSIQSYVKTLTGPAQAALEDYNKVLETHDVSTQEAKEAWGRFQDAVEEMQPSQKAAIKLIREFGEKAGLTKDQVQALINKVTGYTDKVKGVPNSKSTKWTTPGLQQAIDDVKTLKDLIADTHDKEIKITLTRLYKTEFGQFAPGEGSKGGLAGHFAVGGTVPGPYGAGDVIPAWLKPGEFVSTTEAVKHFGVDFFHNLERMAGGSRGAPVTAPAGVGALVGASAAQLGGVQRPSGVVAQEPAQPVIEHIHFHEPTSWTPDKVIDKLRWHRITRGW